MLFNTKKISSFSFAAASLLVLVFAAPASALSSPPDPLTPNFSLETQSSQKIVVSEKIKPEIIERDTYSVVTGEEIRAIQAEEERIRQEAEAARLAEEAEKQKTDSSKYVAPNFTPDPGSAQEYAQQVVASKGWGHEEFNCLVSLWNKESGWRANALNSSSGAYGIPQSLPGNKMASAGADWETNANTQINWGIGYIENRYGTPCGAWGHSVENNWY